MGNFGTDWVAVDGALEGSGNSTFNPCCDLWVFRVLRTFCDVILRLERVIITEDTSNKVMNYKPASKKSSGSSDEESSILLHVRR
jgi:hypothetical protein